MLESRKLLRKKTRNHCKDELVEIQVDWKMKLHGCRENLAIMTCVKKKKKRKKENHAEYCDIQMYL